MARLETWYKQDLKKPVLVHRMETVFNQDALGHLFGVEVYDNGQPVTLAGSVNGYCLLADGTTVPVLGTRTENKAYIVLPQTAYSVLGQITITVKLTEGTAITTLLAVVGVVARSRSGQQVNPGSTITDWTNQIADALQDVEDASAAQDSKISDLKSVFVNYDRYVVGNENYLFGVGWVEGYYIAENGAESQNASFHHSNEIDIGESTSCTLIIKGVSATSTIRIHGYNISDVWQSQITTFNVNDTNIHKFTFAIPSGMKYVRVSLAKAIEVYVLCDSNTVPVQFSEVNTKVDKVQNDFYDLDSLVVPIRGLNIFNVDDTETGYFLQYTNGKPYYISGYGESNYIRVKQSTTYYADGVGSGCQVCYYTKKKEFISGALLNSGSGSFTTPSNCIYIRISFATSGQYMRLFESDTTHDFVPFKLYGYEFVGGDAIRGFMVVDKEGTDGCYNTLTKAVANANDGAIIFVKKGIYNGEKVKAWGKNITIIGEDMQNTVIMNELSAYGNPPIEFSIGTIENITFYAKEGETSGVTPAYACHVEDNSLADSNLTFKHCVFKSDKNAGLGMGMRKGCNVIFDDCAFESRDTYALFFHDAADSTYAGDQKVTFKNCTMYAHTGDYAVRIDSQKQIGTNVYCTFIDNVLATDSGTVKVNTINSPSGGSATTEGTLYYLINFYKTWLCYGNNLNGLNGHERTPN